MIYESAIIGAGSSGIMAYLRSVLNNNKCVLFKGDKSTTKKSRGTWVPIVDNIPGIQDMKRPITSSSRSTLKWLREHPTLSQVGTVIPAAATKLSGSEGNFKITYNEADIEQSIFCKRVIVATGVMDIQPEINGSIEPILPYANMGDVIYCVRCDGHHTMQKEFCVIGNNDDAIHIAALIYQRYQNPRVWILKNGGDFKFSRSALEKARTYNFEIIPDAITAVFGDPRKTGLEGFEFSDKKQIKVSKAIVSLGIIAYNDLLKQLNVLLADNGRALVDEHCETSVPGVFVVGDLTAGKKMQIYTGWDDAVDAADAIDRRKRNEQIHI